MASILTIPIFTGLSRPHSGGQHRTRAIVEQLRRFGHENLVLENASFYAPEDDRLARVYCYNELQAFGLSLGLLRDLNPSFTMSLMRVLMRHRVDVIQVGHPSGAIAVRVLQLLCHNKAPIVYDAHNVDFELMRETMLHESQYPRLVRRIAVAYTRLLERFLVRHLAEAIVAVSQRDAAILLRTYGVEPGRVSEIPSGCYLHPLLDDAERRRVREELGIPEGKVVVVFHGLFTYFPNTEAFRIIREEIAPGFRDRFRDVMFLLAGTGVPTLERDNVKAVGHVSDLYRLLACADIAVVPILHGSGTRLKILDYLSVGLPIVSTKKGAEGLDLESGINALIVGDSSEAIAAGLEWLLVNRDAWPDLSRNAVRVAEQNYDWNAIGRKLDELYSRMGKRDK